MKEPRRIDKEETLKFLNSNALEWFKIHADQRMKLFSFYVLILGGFVFLSGTLVTTQKPFYLLLAGTAFLCVSLVFIQLDKRISELIKTAEQSLMKIEAHFAKEVELPEVEMVKAAQKKNGTYSYSRCFGWIFLVGVYSGLFVAISAFCEVPLVSSDTMSSQIANSASQ